MNQREARGSWFAHGKPRVPFLSSPQFLSLIP
jgi:hypothetical protein